MRNNQRKDNSALAKSLKNLIKNKNNIENDWQIGLGNTDDDNGNKKNKTNRKYNAIQLLAQQFKETIQQNELNWSINQMNRYLQSTNYFKIMYNAKMKVYKSVNSVIGLFTRGIVHKTGITNNRLCNNANLFKPNQFFIYVIIGSLSFCFLRSIFKGQAINHRRWLFRNKVKSKDNTAKVLHETNKELTNNNNSIAKLKHIYKV